MFPSLSVGGGLEVRGDKKMPPSGGVNPLGGGSYICVRLILGRII